MYKEFIKDLKILFEEFAKLYFVLCGGIDDDYSDEGVEVDLC